MTSCVGCPFGGPEVYSKGPLDAPIIILGEGPGREEAREGIPFVGPSGVVLHEALERFNVDGDFLYMNAIRCVSGAAEDKSASDMLKAVVECNVYLLEVIRRHPRRLIVALGNWAVKAVTQERDPKITKIRGKLLASDLAELGVLPVVNPAALLRGTGSYRQFRADIEYAKRLLDGAPREYCPPKYVWVQSDAEYHEALDDLESGTHITADIETSGFDFKRDEILAIGLCRTYTSREPYPREGTVWCFGREWLQMRRLRELLGGAEGKRKFCWHNGKFDVKFLWSHGITAHIDDDTMLMSYTLDESGGVHDLETVAGDYIGAPDFKDMLKPYLPNKDTSYAEIPPVVLMEYLALDVGNTARIYNTLVKLVQDDDKARGLYYETLIPAAKAIARMELNGIYVDTQRLEENVELLSQRVDACREEIQEICGYPINPASPQQVSKALFEQFHMPRNKKGSTAQQYLEKMPQIPIVTQLLEHRKASKLYGTYAKGMHKHIRFTDNRIYPTFHIHGTRTGRLSSADPNLQNIPRDPQYRGMFAAPPGHQLLEIDLSQAELRSLALLSGDPIMCEVYTQGKDLHTELAIALFPGWLERSQAASGTTEYLQAYEQRVRCKNINFGIIYGITPQGLARQMELPTQECKSYLEGWGRRFRVAWEFILRCRETPLKRQIISTVFGRQKRVALVTSSNLHHLQNEAANFPHQSIASDITLHTNIKISPQVHSWGCKIVNSVHDSILIEVPTEDPRLLYKVAEYGVKEMEATPLEWGLTGIPFVADAEAGHRWGSLEKLDLSTRK